MNDFIIFDLNSSVNREGGFIVIIHKVHRLNLKEKGRGRKNKNQEKTSSNNSCLHAYLEAGDAVGRSEGNSDGEEARNIALIRDFELHRSRGSRKETC